MEFDREATTDSDWSGLVEFPTSMLQPTVLQYVAALPSVTVLPSEIRNIDITRYLSDPDGDDVTIGPRTPFSICARCQRNCFSDSILPSTRV